MDEPTGAYVKIAEAASILGVSIDTVRRRLRRGELRGERMPTRHGAAWYIWIEDTTQLALDGDDAPPGRAGGAAHRGEVSDLVRLVSRLQVENRTLATQVGFLEAELRQARAEAQALRALNTRGPHTPEGLDAGAGARAIHAGVHGACNDPECVQASRRGRRRRRCLDVEVVEPDAAVMEDVTRASDPG
jgi:hypothetical protein